LNQVKINFMRSLTFTTKYLTVGDIKKSLQNLPDSAFVCIAREQESLCAHAHSVSIDRVVTPDANDFEESLVISVNDSVSVWK